MEMGSNAHTSMHAYMIQFLSIKEGLLSTLKRDEHGHMACILSSEIMLEKVSNQLNKSSKTSSWLYTLKAYKLECKETIQNMLSMTKATGNRAKTY